MRVEILAWNRTDRRLAASLADGVTLHVFDFKPIGREPVPLALSYLAWWGYVFASLVSDDVAVCHAQGLFSLPPVLVAKLFRHIELVYDLIDFVADSFTLGRAARKVLTKLENFLLGLAAGTIVVDTRKQPIDLTYVRRLAVINNCPRDYGGTDKQQGDDGVFRIYYGGALFKERGLSILCESIRGLEKVQAIVAGSGPYTDEVVTLAERQPNVRYVGLLSEAESLRWTRMADGVFAYYDPRVPINRKAVPAKLFDAMMCSTPVLVNSESQIASEIVSEEDCGISSPYADVEALRTAIANLRDNPAVARRLGENGRKAFEREYNWSVMERRLRNLYGSILDIGPRESS